MIINLLSISIDGKTLKELITDGKLMGKSTKNYQNSFMVFCWC